MQVGVLTTSGIATLLARTTRLVQLLRGCPLAGQQLSKP